MVNDSVSIILFQAVLKIFSGGSGINKVFKWYTTFELLGNFLLVTVCSVGIGLGMGI